MVNSSLVDELINQNLASPFKLHLPIHLGSVEKPHAMTITHAVELPVRDGDVFFTHIFGIANIPAPPHIIMGQPWLKKYCPDALKILNEFGIQTLGKLPSTTEFNHGLPTPVNSPSLEPTKAPACRQRSLPEPPPIALPPCSNPATAFSAGGGPNILAAIESEQHNRKEAEEKYKVCTHMRAQIERIQENRFHTAQVRAAAATGSNDPGVRGLTGNDEGWLETIPPEYRHFADTIFSDDAANDLPQFRPDSDCKIELREGEVLRQSKLYDMSQEELQQLKKLLDLELQRGFIRPSKAASSAPIFFVRDPSSGTRSGQLRLVVDYRDLNSKIKQDEYPIPLTRTVMNDLAGADWITTMDVRSGFSNIRIAPGSEHLTAFKSFYGLYEYTVMPMGLSTAPAVFQRFINSVLNPYLGIFCHAYLDDVVIYTKGNLQTHKDQVLKVLEALQENGLRLKPKKCKWFKKECDFLGFTVVCGKGVRMADDKIQGLHDIEPPTGVKDLRSFLGKVNFYDQLIPHYSDTVACLTDLTKKDVPWDWSPKCQKAFQTLLDAVRNDVYMRAFTPGKPIRLSTDASDAAYGGMMEQEYEDGWRPFLLFHHKFKDAEKRWDIHDKELWAIVFAFLRYRHILSQNGPPTQVFADHRNLAKFMFTTDLLKSHDGRLGRWWETLSQSNFEIQYLTGKENVIPDFLSRYGQPDSVSLEPKILLPAFRFSSKALADIEEWFKSSKLSPNVREKLESRFAKNQISSPVPVPEPSLSQELSAPRTRITLGQVLSQDVPHQPEVDGISRCASVPQDPICLGTFSSPRTRSLAQSLGLCFRPGYPDYCGARLSSILPGANHRLGKDRRGLGAPLTPLLDDQSGVVDQASPTTPPQQNIPDTSSNPSSSSI
jgi:hypothetical protein